MEEVVNRSETARETLPTQMVAETGTGAQVDMTSVAGAEANYLVGDFVAS